MLAIAIGEEFECWRFDFVEVRDWHILGCSLA
jgi:hypothetical protein